MAKDLKIEASDEAWDSGELGKSEQFVEVATDIDDEKINEAVALQLISLRLQKALIDDFKYIAQLNGIGYQTLMRQVLMRFADCEKKRILKEMASLAKAGKLEERKRA